MGIRLLTGDCRDVLKTLPEESVHCVVTSPPYWGLRDYGVAGQIGLEPTFDQFIAEMVGVFREVRRVLRSDGTLWLNLGDSYAGGGNGGGGNFAADRANWRVVPTRSGQRAAVDGLKPKDLCGIPWRVAFALQADGWWLRQDIIWAKPNPMPESVTDRCTKAHEYIFLLSKSARYWYDAEAIKEPLLDSSLERGYSAAYMAGPTEKMTAAPKEVRAKADWRTKETAYVPQSRNKRSVWEVATAPFSEAHFATFPPELIEPCIKAGCPDKCCPHCGKGWERQTVADGYTQSRSGNHAPAPNKGHLEEHQDRELAAGLTARGFVPNRSKITRDLGFQPACSCPAHQPIPGTCLDPFGGAGTTGLVADRLQRNAILIELNPQYAAMAERRIQGDAPLFAEVAAE